MYDAALFYGPKATKLSAILNRLGTKSQSYVLATIHRAENTDTPERLKSIFKAFAKFKYPIVLPLHPRTRSGLVRDDLDVPENVQLIDPVGYLDMVMLEQSALLIATDSGGVQKEAFFYKVPCVTLREETEWTELLEAGWNRLATPDSSEKILRAMESAINTQGNPLNVYGDGTAAGQIAKQLLSNQ